MEDKNKSAKIQGLLSKPSTKPNFGPLSGSSVLAKAAAFLPKFKESTDTLLANPELLEKAIIEGCGGEQENEGKQMIKLDLGIGVFDVNGEAGVEEEIKHESLPKVRYCCSLQTFVLT